MIVFVTALILTASAVVCLLASVFIGRAAKDLVRGAEYVALAAEALRDTARILVPPERRL